MKSLDARVAVVHGGGSELGRATALALAARGVRVVVVGPEERALGETVGEIVFGGGKARHVAGDARDPEVLRAAVERAVSTFGGLDFVLVAAEGAGAGDIATAQRAFAAARGALGGSPQPRLVVVASELDPAWTELVRATRAEDRSSTCTCNLVTRGAPGPADLPADDELARLVTFVCSAAAGKISGRTLTVG